MCAAGSLGLESARRAGVAQLVEQLICNQWVGSSILSAGTSITRLPNDCAGAAQPRR
jgi:hypothetical protein